MKMSLLKKFILGHIETCTNAYIQGPPGVGKTMGIQEICAEDASICLVQRHAANMQPTDQGMPWKSPNSMTLDMIPARWLPLECNADLYQGYRRIVVLLDELAQGSNDTQKFVGNLIREREFMGHKVLPNVCFIMTGNRVKDRTGAAKILPHVADRATFYDLDLDADDLVSWCLSKKMPVWALAFIRFKPGLFTSFDPQLDKNCTPRGFAEMVFQWETGKFPADGFYEFCTGHIGEGPAREVVAFKQTFHQLPNITQLLLDPDNTPLPTERSAEFAMAGALAHHAKVDNFDRVMRVAKRLPDETALVLVRDAVMRDKGLYNTEAFIEWAASNQGAIL